MLLLDTYGMTGVRPGEFSGPVDLCNRQDRVYVADQWNHRIQVLTTSLDLLSTWGGYGNGDGEFNQPVSVSLSNNSVVVSEFAASRVQLLDTDGKFQAVLATPGGAPGQVSSPTGSAFVDEQTFAVCDDDYDRIQIFGVDGVAVAAEGGTGTGLGQLSSPRGVSVTNGTIYVADRDNNRIARYTDTLQPMPPWPRSDEVLAGPYDVSVRGTYAAVADRGNARVVILDEKGFLADSYSGDPGFSPFSVTWIADDEILVGDAASNTLLRLSARGGTRREPTIVVYTDAQGK